MSQTPRSAAGRGQAIDQLVDAVAGVLVGGLRVRDRRRRAPGRRPGSSCGCGRTGPSGRRGRTRGRAGRGRRAGRRAGSRCIGRRRRPRSRPPRRRTAAGPASARPGTARAPSRARRTGPGRRTGGPSAARAGLDDGHLGAAGLEPQERLGPQEAEPADLLAADDALEQERRGGPLDPAEGRDRGQPVAGQLAVDRDARRRRVEAAGEFFVRGAIATHRQLVRRKMSRGNGNACTLTAGRRDRQERARPRRPGGRGGSRSAEILPFLALRAAPMPRVAASAPAPGLLDTPGGRIRIRSEITLHRELTATLPSGMLVVRPIPSGTRDGGGRRWGRRWRGSGRRSRSMKCQKCAKPATFHITDIIEKGKHREFHFCDEHARQHLAPPEEALERRPMSEIAKKLIVSARARSASRRRPTSRSARSARSRSWSSATRAGWAARTITRCSATS